SLLARAGVPVAPEVPASVDPGRDLGAGERGVLAYSLASSLRALCVLDDRAARAEARRLGLPYTGTLGLILRAKMEGRLALALPARTRSPADSSAIRDAFAATRSRPVSASSRARSIPSRVRRPSITVSSARSRAPSISSPAVAGAPASIRSAHVSKRRSFHQR